jgi:hypothetical protein
LSCPVVRRTPARPSWRISRAVWSRPISTPPRRSVHLAHPVDAVVGRMDLGDDRLQLAVTHRPHRERSALRRIVGRRGDRQVVLAEHRADRLDPRAQAVDPAVLALVDEPHQRCCAGRSRPAALERSARQRRKPIQPAPGNTVAATPPATPAPPCPGATQAAPL